MAIQSVGINNEVTTKNDKSVKTGAKIGAVSGMAVAGFNSFKSKELINDVFRSTKEVIGKKGAIATVVVGLALGGAALAGLGAGIGAGIGKLVKAVKANNAQKHDSAEV